MKFKKRHLWWLLTPFLFVGIVVLFQAFLHARQKHAIEKIERLGGRVLTTHGDPEWLRLLPGGKSLTLFEKATVVNLSETKITDSDLNVLTQLNAVERLNLNETQITNDGLEYLEGLTGLKALDLSQTQISGEGLNHLHGLTNLEYLYLSGTKIRDADLHHLHGLQNLQNLDLTETSVTQAGVVDIEKHIPGIEVEW